MCFHVSDCFEAYFGSFPFLKVTPFEVIDQNLNVSHKMKHFYSEVCAQILLYFPISHHQSSKANDSHQTEILEDNQISKLIA